MVCRIFLFAVLSGYFSTSVKTLMQQLDAAKGLTFRQYHPTKFQNTGTNSTMEIIELWNYFGF